MKAACFESEYNFQKERVDRLEGVVVSSQNEIDSQLARWVEGEKRALALQEIISEKDETIITKQGEIKSLTEQLQSLTVEVSAATEAEKRAKSQIEQMKQSTKNMQDLEESAYDACK